MLRSRRGANGGYTFARPPQSVTVLDVVDVLDGFEASGGLHDRASAERLDGLRRRSVWAETKAAMERVLRTTTIAILAERERHAAAATGAAMYHI